MSNEKRAETIAFLHSEVLQLQQKTVLLFFGAKWAEPCEAFRALLQQVYEVPPGRCIADRNGA